MIPLPSHLSTPPGPHAAPYPAAPSVVDRLDRVLGAPASVGPSTLRWWVHGDSAGMGLAILYDTVAPAAGEPSVIWVTRPGEAQTERCPIVSMAHLESFLALVSVARHSTTPVRGHVCPGED